LALESGQDPGADALTRAFALCDDESLVIAIRGTPPLTLEFGLPRFLDAARAWFLNLRVGGRGRAAGDIHPSLTGFIHPGFADIAESLWPWIRDAVTAAARRRVVLTGHSQGGAVAVLLGVMLACHGMRCRVITFGAPRIGDGDFGDSLPEGLAITRFELADDLVPHLPPSPLFRDIVNWFADQLLDETPFGPLDFQHVGTLRFINRDGMFARNHGLKLEYDRLKMFLSTVRDTVRRPRMVRDHLVARYSVALLRALCPKAARCAPTTLPGRALDAAVRGALEGGPLQPVVDTMESIAIEGATPTADIAWWLENLATLDVSHLHGQIGSDWLYIRQTALWTLDWRTSRSTGWEASREPPRHGA